jgi:hypothetical protein
VHKARQEQVIRNSIDLYAIMFAHLGKSYLGVCLALAFNEVRDLLEEHGFVVGPVVILAYKNHALDEFLVDMLSHVNGHADNLLIRCGNPDNENLQRYREKSTKRELERKAILDNRLCVLRNCKCILRDWKDLAKRLLDANLNSPNDIKTWRPYYGSNLKEGKSVFHSVGAMYNALLLFFGSVPNKQHWVPPDTGSASDAAFNIAKIINSSSLSAEVAAMEGDILGTLPQICAGLDHWLTTNPSRLLFLIEEWLSGVTPPVKCKIVNCPVAASQGLSLCEGHRCCGSRCDNRRIVNGKFCNSHACVAIRGNGKQCSGQSIIDGSNYCVDHACLLCIDTGCDVRQRLGEACSEHSCEIRDCAGMQIKEFKFCVSHLCRECGILSCQDGLPAKGEYCSRHSCAFRDCDNKAVGSDMDLNFCFSHACKFCWSKFKVLIPVHCTVPSSDLCSDHKCLVNECPSARMDVSQFCVLHSCSICLKTATLENPVSNICTEEAPRNVCVEHALCEFILKSGRSCSCSRIAGSSFCRRHSLGAVDAISTVPDLKRYGFCCGKNRNGAPCGDSTMKDSRIPWYCNAHKKQRPAALPEGDSPEVAEEDDTAAITAEEYLFEMAALRDEELQKLKIVLTQDRDECEAVTAFGKPVLLSCIQCTPQSNCRVNTFGPRGSEFVCKYHRPEVHRASPVVEFCVVKKMASVDPEFVFKDSECYVIPPATKSAEEVNISGMSATLHGVEGGEDIRDEVFADPDEMDYYDNEINENLERVKEMIEIGEVFDEDQDEKDNAGDAEDSVTDDVNISVNTLRSSQDILESFSWDLSLAERFELLGHFLVRMSRVLEELNTVVDSYVDLARADRVQAAAHAYKHTRFIGATVVGAARKLHAIRRAEPFAIIVEEACEVMEPTLMSVLAVSSVGKLEMIGDHRQLPAFVQQCWFSLEMQIPSIKTSLFERLITGQCAQGRYRSRDNGVKLPFSVLDEQRRMRKEIADLTRTHYSDVVTILDHTITGTQRIGDKVIGKAKEDLAQFRQVWSGHGRLVPGIPHVVHFWDLVDNKESPADVGLSACNKSESKAVVELTKYLLLCKVPPSSISIITPYKGQQRTIFRELQESKCLPKFTHESKPRPGTTITVSTVDRYQGDENDIVILSLVRVAPGNRFVALLNRFIVAVSRARMGFFIVGSVHAVTKNECPDGSSHHWNQFVELLRSPRLALGGLCVPSIGDAAPVGVSGDMPVCCPQHPLTCRPVRRPDQFPRSSSWSSFCDQPCHHVLSCRHACGLPCHFTDINAHNMLCTTRIPRSCVRHANVPLLCHEVKVKNSFECRVKMSYARPDCGHVVSVDCFDESMLRAGLISLPECTEVETDYVHPNCNHVISNPTCSEKQLYECKPPECMELIHFKNRCGCLMRIHCSARQREEEYPSICKRPVNFLRPRCGHQLSKRCFQRSEICNNWSLPQGGERATRDPQTGLLSVHQNTLYGSPDGDVVCAVPVVYVRSCAHILSEVPCGRAFSYAADPSLVSPCLELVSHVCLFCKSSLAVKCSLSEAYKDWRNFADVFLGLEFESDGGTSLRESVLANAAKPQISEELVTTLRTCQGTNVVLIRNCGHRTKISCRELIQVLFRFQKLPACKEKFEKPAPCGHCVEDICSSLRLPLCKAPISEVFTFSCGEHTATIKRCDELRKVQHLDPPCKAIVTAKRFRCGHHTQVVCSSKQDLEKARFGKCFPCKSSEPITVSIGETYCCVPSGCPPCAEIVDIRYDCGHLLKNVACDTAFKLCAGSTERPDCIVLVPLKSPLCGHTVSVVCAFQELFLSWVPWLNGPPKIAQEIVDQVGEDGVEDLIRVYLVADIAACRLVPLSVPDAFSSCCRPTFVELPCGHAVKVSCGEAVTATVKSCQQLVDWKCGDCSFVEKIKCSDVSGSHQNGRKCRNVVLKRCSVCAVNDVSVLCSISFVECNTESTAKLSCGHEITWNCGEQDHPLQVETKCQVCARESWTAATIPTTSERITEHKDAYIAAINECIRAALSKLPVAWSIVDTVDISHDELTCFIRAQESVRRAHMDRCWEKDADYGAPPPDVIYAEAVQHLDIVFSSNIGDFTGMKPTNYGRGFRLELLSQPSLLSWQFETDGSTAFYVGVAFKLRTHPSMAPFRLARRGQNSKTDAAETVKANRIMTQLISQGYDSVSVNTEGPSGSVTENCRRIYWHPGTVLCSCKISCKLLHQCCICKEYFADEVGIRCCNRHLLCEDCFNAYADSITAPGGSSGTSSVDKNDQLTCPECRVPYSLYFITGHCSERIFNKIQEVTLQLNARRQVRSAIHEVGRQHKAEMKQFQEELNRTELRAELLRRDIVSEILNLGCPRCRIVFVDFEGCFALTCHACGCGFCAWCLLDCGVDAHTHVPGCKENRVGGISAPIDAFYMHHRERRRNKTLEAINNETDSKIRDRVRELLMPELKDLGIIL